MPFDTTSPSISPGPAGLRYVSPDEPGIARRRAGRGFSYVDAEGERVTAKVTLARIRALAIPPAWRRVWICADPDGHLQAVGEDARGRRQYRYHARFRAVQEEAKFEHLLDFARVLPAVRDRVSADLARPGLDERKVLAVVVRLLESTLIRVGNAEYARANGSYGLTTLLNRHVEIDHADLRFRFKGKSGKLWRLKVHDRRIARIVKSCQDLPGQHLFQYLDPERGSQAVTSAAVNAYLQDITGADITAKDFRTWHGTVLAALALAGEDGAEGRASKRRVRQAVVRVAARLGNTPSVCRKCYVHPEVIAAYLEGVLDLPAIDDDAAGEWSGLRPQEAAVLAFLEERIGPPARPDSAL